MKSFLEGMKNAFNLFPPDRTEQPKLPTHSDAEALQKDLERAGADMYAAIHIIESERYQ